MDSLNNHSYYLARANAARELARRAANPSIAAIHHEMASRYERTAAQTGQGGTDGGNTQAD